MAGTNKPDRVGAPFVNNYRGNATPAKQNGKTPPRKSAASASNVGGSDMAQPNNAPLRRGGVADGKNAYVRSHVGVEPTGLPMKRTADGSVLTSGSKDQPFGRTKGQQLSKLKKGGAD